MAKYACVRTDNMSGTTLGKNLVSAKYEGAIENGNIVVIGDLLEGEREVRKATTPAVNSALRNLALVATPEVVKEKAYHTLAEFKNEDGDIIRAYRLISGDMFSVTAEALDGTAEVGSVVEAQASTKMKVVAEATEGSTVIGKVIALEGEWIVIEVV